MFPEGFGHTIFCDNSQQDGLEYYPLIYQTESSAASQAEGMVENIFVDLEEIQLLLNHKLMPENSG
jgi:hypothetical protein